MPGWIKQGGGLDLAHGPCVCHLGHRTFHFSRQLFDSRWLRNLRDPLKANPCIPAGHAGLDVVCHPEGGNTQLVCYHDYQSALCGGDQTYNTANDAEDLTETNGNCVSDGIVEPLAQGTLKPIIPLISMYLS